MSTVSLTNSDRLPATARVAAGAFVVLGLLARAQERPAFPGAEGFGATTPGGRGGRVIGVTTVDDDGPGSFRQAVAAKGPRTVVFPRTAGGAG
jgi:hypothetical protein